MTERFPVYLWYGGKKPTWGISMVDRPVPHVPQNDLDEIISRRDRYFSRSVRAVDVEIDGTQYRFLTSPSFWKARRPCIELRDAVRHDPFGRPIEELKNNHNLQPWQKCELEVMESYRSFRLHAP